MNLIPEPLVLRVALDTPLRRLFDYLPPAAGLPVRAGTRVRVPFGRQRRIGVVIATSGHTEVPSERLKPVLEVLDAEPVLDPAALALLAWAAEYYHHPLGEVAAGALPKALRLGAPSVAREERWILTAEGAAAHAAGEPRRAPRQRSLLGLLADSGGSRASLLSERLPGWREPARALLARGWLASAESLPDAPSGAAAQVRPGAPQLSEEQALAVQTIGGALGAFGAFVLHGITGSGKTEVYLRLIEQVLAAGRRALVLVPEIALTPQLVARFRERFDTPIAVLHSGLTDHERLVAWRARLQWRGAPGASARARRCSRRCRARAHRRRRGARCLLQAARGSAALLGARPRGGARTAPALPVVLGSRDAVARDAAERGGRPLHAGCACQRRAAQRAAAAR